MTRNMTRLTETVTVHINDFMDEAGSHASCSKCGWESEASWSVIDAIKAGRAHICPKPI